MKNLNIFLGILTTLAISRFIPHPPNFTIAIAMSFYAPFIFGQKKIFYVLASFIITDLIIGYHLTTHWTWGSILIIGFIYKLFKKNLIYRLFGVLSSALLFFILTNFGVWTLGQYGYHLSGLVKCYILAIPFFGNTLISSIIFAAIIEIFYFLYIYKFASKKKINF
tara:strand:- start:2 stop:499 length:498 start_codon:yes stop_codon:yes gene_type:complete